MRRRASPDATSVSTEAARRALGPIAFTYIAGWYDAATASGLYAGIDKESNWQRPASTMLGKGYTTPRDVNWHGDQSNTYGRITLVPQPWLPGLEFVRLDLERFTEARHNTCLASRYTTGADTVGWHADDELELGQQPNIASVSLGATRRLRIRHTSTRRTWTLTLEHGSLLLMTAESQTDYVHQLLRQANARPRINLTYRWTHPPRILNDDTARLATHGDE